MYPTILTSKRLLIAFFVQDPVHASNFQRADIVQGIHQYVVRLTNMIDDNIWVRLHGYSVVGVKSKQPSGGCQIVMPAETSTEKVWMQRIRNLADPKKLRAGFRTQ